MPNFDRKGPNGDGPMSGGRRGRCNQANANSDFDRPRRRGGRGLGNGRNFKQNNSDNYFEKLTKKLNEMVDSDGKQDEQDKHDATPIGTDTLNQNIFEYDAEKKNKEEDKEE